jgi:peptidoglycan/LPS O-acetylase OafA/YrhL
MILWLTSAVLLVLCPEIELYIRPHLSFLRMPDKSLGELLASYAASLCFAANMLAFNALSDGAERLFLPFTRLIRWLGSMTFAFYLFHQPLLSLFTVYSLDDRSSAAQFLLLIGGTFLIVATLGRLCEQSKGAYKRFFLSMWGRAATLRLRYGAQTR